MPGKSNHLVGRTRTHEEPVISELGCFTGEEEGGSSSAEEAKERSSFIAVTILDFQFFNNSADDLNRLGTMISLSLDSSQIRGETEAAVTNTIKRVWVLIWAKFL
ncbi:hypothetical protein V6N11_076550 [Hibiscus sabdariffa]|uniref:Uncharacterized protein n=1 Tax=Hibiscus sabdariffa TaxID=183260 RepID=A0ABR2Q6L9_9ROSI